MFTALEFSYLYFVALDTFFLSGGRSRNGSFDCKGCRPHWSDRVCCLESSLKLSAQHFFAIIKTNKLGLPGSHLFATINISCLLLQMMCSYDLRHALGQFTEMERQIRVSSTVMAVGWLPHCGSFPAMVNGLIHNFLSWEHLKILQDVWVWVKDQTVAPFGTQPLLELLFYYFQTKCSNWV